MPDFPIVDSHVHIWDPSRIDYPWLGDAGHLNARYLPATYDEACGEVEVEHIVFVECDAKPSEAFAEVDWVTGQSNLDSRIEAIVAFAPLDNGASVRPHLERLRDNALVKGVRRIYQSEPDTEFCLRPDFVAGVRALAPLGLSFDMCITHRHIQSSVELARRCDAVPIVLDHIGKPAIRDGRYEFWRSQMFAMAELDNVVCKLSGVATQADHKSWTPEILRPYIDTTLEAFGPKRTMFGGDWPVATSAVSYPRWVEVVDHMIAGLSADEKADIYRNTAARFYGLPVDTRKNAV